MIVLDWPPKELNPNARVHFHVKANAARHYRESAHWLTKAARALPPAQGLITLRLDFYPPDRRKRDLDNMLASAKSGLDGIAQALGIDDQRFALYLHRQEPCKPGKIVVQIS